ncbi:MAG: hypothetical protein AAF249_03915 [Pseudomonadota bacterium]
MKVEILSTFDRLMAIATRATARSAASQDHNEDYCGPVYASEITGIRFLLKGKTRFWQFRQLRLSKGGSDETFGSEYQPAGAASDGAPASRKATHVVISFGNGVSGYPYMVAAVVESYRNPFWVR